MLVFFSPSVTGLQTSECQIHGIFWSQRSVPDSHFW